MGKQLMVCTVALLMIAACAVDAVAQYDEDGSGRLSIKVGLYRPSGTKVREEGGSIWKTYGADYAVKLDDKGRPELSLSLERSTRNENGFKGRLTSLRGSRLWHRKSAEARGPYYGVGAGIYVLDEDIASRFVPPSTIVPAESHSGARLGFSVIGGYDFNESWFVELRYNKIGKLASDADFSGLTFCAGVKRFY